MYIYTIYVLCCVYAYYIQYTNKPIDFFLYLFICRLNVECEKNVYDNAIYNMYVCTRIV